MLELIHDVQSSKNKGAGAHLAFRTPFIFVHGDSSYSLQTLLRSV